MHDKIKQLRKILKLSQEQFAERIGISRSNLCNIEIHRINVTERTKKTICSEFNVNPDWLTGESEEMFMTNRSSIEQFIHDFNFREQDKELLLMFSEMPEAERNALYEVAKNFKSSK